MKWRPFKRGSLLGAFLLLIAGAVWESWAVKAIWAVSALSDPRKLATLGERGANPRLNKILYWLDLARGRGVPAGTVIMLAQQLNSTHQPRASLVEASLGRNMKIADELGLFTPENRESLSRGRSAVIAQGPYRGTVAEVDHIVPVSLAPEVGNELANLELMPAPLNRAKSNRVSERQLAHAEALAHAGLLSKTSLDRVRAQARR